ncbi:MAG: glucosaminidase domain-containing protein [Saccharofermentanales bacterium]
MEQMRRYGIPASVTLAQGILESGSGQSELSRKGNNHFGIKASSSWLESGGRYLVYTDDKPNEKFCQYASVADSYEHHSLFLKGNSRYSSLFALSPDDYVGWTNGLQKAGYATSKSYASSLQSVIKSNGLDKYDKMVMQEQGWQSTKQQTATISELASNSQETASAQNQTVQEQPKQEEKKQEPAQPKDKDYFNTILADSEKESNSWENFFGLNDSTSVAGIDPVVNLVSTLFAGLMAMAVQIDNMGNAVAEQQSVQQAQSVDANALASQNFDNAMNSSINNPIKRTRS